MATEFKRDKLCDCTLCRLAYELIDVLDKVITPEKHKEIDTVLKITEEVSSREKLILTILIVSVAEFAFREGAPVPYLLDLLSTSWNKRAKLAAALIIEQSLEEVPDEIDLENMKGPFKIH